MSRLTRDGTAEPVSRDQILRREHREGNNIHFPCSADHEQDWQPYPVDPYSYYMCDHTYKHSSAGKLSFPPLLLGVSYSNITHHHAKPIFTSMTHVTFVRLKNIMDSSHIYIYTHYSKRKRSFTTINNTVWLFTPPVGYFLIYPTTWISRQKTRLVTVHA